MKHDQIWKEVLWTFFRDFLELFFPDVAERIDFNSVHQVNKEFFTDIPSGKLRQPDLLVQACTREGEIELILVHVEVQAKRERTVPFRMWEYYSLLRLRKKCPVFPLVLYLAPGGGGVAEEEYRETLFGRNILAFNYCAISLLDLPAEEYMESENVLAPALSALMHTESVDRVSRKLKAYERLAKSHMDEASCSLLMNVVDQYLMLDKSEQTELERRINDIESKEVTEMLTQWHQRGMKEGLRKGKAEGISQGITEGISQGIAKGKQETLIRQMQRKFGKLPDDALSIIQSISNVDTLDELADRVLDAKTLEEMRLHEIR